MGKQHLKRLTLPRTWPIEKKVTTFITKPMPGPHSKEMSMPLSVVLKLYFGVKTTAEAKSVLRVRSVLVNGVRRVEHRFPVGLFDVIFVKELGKYYRVVLDDKGYLRCKEINSDEANAKPCKIIGKTVVPGGKIQLNFSDGRSILVEKNAYRTEDTLLIAVPENQIKEHVALEKGAFVLLIGGKHIGRIGSVVDISEQTLMFKDSKGDVFETYRKYAFALGKNKPLVSLIQ